MLGFGAGFVAETWYRSSTPGTDTVVLEAWGGDSSGLVSEKVTITC